MQNGNSSFGHFETHTFDNGLRLITVPMKDRKIATVMVIVGTGSRYESKNNNGISHFLEHMMFKGTSKRPGALDISLELDSIGADSNAFTGKEYTGYYARAASEQTDLMLDIIADIFQNSNLDIEEIEKEKGVIVEEINMYLDTPRRYVNDIFEMLLYGDQPLGWDISGDKDNVRSLTQDQIREYFLHNYVAHNTIIAISGNIDTEDIKSKIPKFFGEVRDGGIPSFEAVIESQSEPQFRIWNKKTDQTHINVGVRAYSLKDDRSYALELLSIILGGNMSSRLFTEVREKRGLAYSVNTFVTTFTDAGYLATHLGVDNSKAYDALEVILKEYKKIRDEGVPQSELDKAKSFNRGKVLMALDSPDFIASYVSEQLLLKGEVMTPMEELALYDAVTVEDIKHVAEDIFQNNKLNLSLIGPFEENDPKIKALLVL